MVRTYGLPPYRAALIHGGPGAKGSLGCVGSGLGNVVGILEPMQSAHTVHGLLTELHGQLLGSDIRPLTLIGHSFGAMLALLYASRHPEVVEKLVLADCPPLVEGYEPLLHKARCLRLSPELQAEYEALTAKEDLSAEETERLLCITEATDTFEKDPQYTPNTDEWDMTAYSELWGEVCNMRRGGVFLHAAQRVEQRIFVLHGEHDPHPLKGVILPLADAHCDFVTCVLPMCGHSPYTELHAKDAFLSILTKII